GGRTSNPCVIGSGRSTLEPRGSDSRPNPRCADVAHCGTLEPMPAVGDRLSDRGLRRELNEDAYAYAPELDLFLVADGMGGHAAGEVASRTAADTITAKLQGLLADDDLSPVPRAECSPGVGARRLALAVECANDLSFRRPSANPSQRGMGT